MHLLTSYEEQERQGADAGAGGGGGGGRVEGVLLIRDNI